MRGSDSERQPGPDRGQSPAGNGCGAGFPKPLQGRGTSPRIARITRVSAERICGNLRGLRAVWLAAVHWCFFRGEDTKIK